MLCVCTLSWGSSFLNANRYYPFPECQSDIILAPCMQLPQDSHVSVCCRPSVIYISIQTQCKLYHCIHAVFRASLWKIVTLLGPISFYTCLGLFLLFCLSFSPFSHFCCALFPIFTTRSLSSAFLPMKSISYPATSASLSPTLPF